ncbi:MAG: hydantoinase B/oxoprolinase family protein [Oligoflexales bacterium]
MQNKPLKWQFWVDRGGTFTDIVGRSPNGKLISKKYLSTDPQRYEDAVLAGVLEFLEEHEEHSHINSVSVLKIGTTVATNALLERKGSKVALFITKGFKDLLFIGDQTRPNIFARNINRVDPLYQGVFEIDERLDASGRILTALNEVSAKKALRAAFEDGFRSCAVVLMHSYLNSVHENKIVAWAKEIGFQQVSSSSQLVPLIKIVPRGQTCVMDAYLSPVLTAYKNLLYKGLEQSPIMFMQSNGGLIEAEKFKGMDAILSGPAGGMVGAVKTALQNNIKKVISFDMGGTSTDVGLYDGTYLRNFEPTIEGMKLRVPSLDIHTIAAGGGSLLSFYQGRLQVGPESAGALPGPAAYGKGGPLTITDCNVLLGRIQANFFPKVFGSDGNQALDTSNVTAKFKQLLTKIEHDLRVKNSTYELADLYLEIACQKMANAIRKISTGRGYDISQFTLSSFGGAGGQHACRVASHLGINTIFIHPLAGVLSALGIGIADLNYFSQRSVAKCLNPDILVTIELLFKELEIENDLTIAASPAPPEQVLHKRLLYLRYEGSDTKIEIPFTLEIKKLREDFSAKHEQYFGFMLDTTLFVESICLQSQGVYDNPISLVSQKSDSKLHETTKVKAYFDGKMRKIDAYDEHNFPFSLQISGPTIIFSEHGTIVVEENWSITKNKKGCFILTKKAQNKVYKQTQKHKNSDPFYLEIFNNLFMSMAENMGEVLKNTASSVNIKEREDYSCAIFDEDGLLVSNAPHMPVHLGSMSESVKSLIAQHESTMAPGQVYIHNSPYSGGTHLPDMTVVSPIFVNKHERPTYYVASRGHHADCGGISPGSMPALSTHISEEGVFLDHLKIVDNNIFNEILLRKTMMENKYPPRNMEQNIADIKAQIAANKRGESEIFQAINGFGVDMLSSYMQHIQDNAEELVREVITEIKDAKCVIDMDQGIKISVNLKVDRLAKSMIVDFSESSVSGEHNFNAPYAVCKAAVLYVLRSLVDQKIPLNDGCLKPIKIILPPGSVLNPIFPRAVVAGNVETSQAIVNALWGALGQLAGSAGTMNNLSFGDHEFQYYETIGGAGLIQIRFFPIFH